MADSLIIGEIREIQKKYPRYSNIQCFIETGTYLGDTIFHMASFFERLYTVELFEQHFQNAVAYAKENEVDNVHFSFGDSAKIIPHLAQSIDEPAIFFLDGHYCGNNSYNVSSDLNFPLFDELRAISMFRNFRDIIIIDDHRLFGQRFEDKQIDWTDVTEKNLLGQFSESHLNTSLVANDRFYILLQPRASSDGFYIPPPPKEESQFAEVQAQSDNTDMAKIAPNEYEG